MDTMNLKETIVHLTKTTGVMPAIKMKEHIDLLPAVQAMVEGGARVVEITMTTPGVLQNFERISAELGDRVYMAAGTVLDAMAARDAIKAGARVLVSPAMQPEVIATALRYGVPCYIGAFTATEVLSAITHGTDMVKIFPAALAGPKYMTNLKMVYPEVNLIPSGGLSLETVGEFIRCGACAVSGARNFYDYAMVKQHGTSWISEQVKKYIGLVAEARQNMPPLP